MVFINEWLPNPKGSDQKGEWIELFNGGSSPADINGWQLATSHSKNRSPPLRGVVAPQEYLVIARAQYKLTLRNNNEALFLYDAGGDLVSSSSFSVTAPEDQSYSRTPSGRFTFAPPTPGAANKAADIQLIHTTAYTAGAPLSPPSGPLTIIGGMLASAFVVAAAVFFLVQYNHDLSDLLFGAHQTHRRRPGAAPR